MKKQSWFCEQCSEVGAVEYEEGAAFFEVLAAIEESHKRAGDCTASIRGISILAPASPTDSAA